MVDQDLQRFALRAEPVAVINQTGIAGHEIVLQVGDLAIEGQTLNRAVGFQKDRSAWGLVTATALHPDVAVLDQIEPTNTVTTADSIEFSQQFMGRERHVVEGDWIARLKGDFNMLSPCGGFFGRHSQAPHGLARRLRGIFENTPLVADVKKIGIHRIGCFSFALLVVNGDAVGVGIGQQSIPREQIPFAPWRNDSDARHQAIGTEFEPDLIITLPRRTVRDRVGFDLAGDFDQSLRDERAGD